MLTENKIITESEIIKIIEKRKKGKFISFEEMYIKGKKYIPNLCNFLIKM